MAFKKAKITPLKKTRTPRGKGGRFKAKAKVKGKADLKHFFSVLRRAPMEIARAELREVAEEAAGSLRLAIITQSVPNMGGRAFGKPRRFDTKLNPFTLKEKRVNAQDPRKLVATGAYLNSIGVVEEKRGTGYTYRVGLLDKMHPSGISMEKLARIQEYGAKIKVTPKMRAYLHWRGLHLKAETQFIVIPARPHWGPLFNQLRREVKRIQQWGSKNLVQELKKQLGAP